MGDEQRDGHPVSIRPRLDRMQQRATDSASSRSRLDCDDLQIPMRLRNGLVERGLGGNQGLHERCASPIPDLSAHDLPSPLVVETDQVLVSKCALPGSDRDSYTVEPAGGAERLTMEESEPRRPSEHLRQPASALGRVGTGMREERIVLKRAAQQSRDRIALLFAELHNLRWWSGLCGYDAPPWCSRPAGEAHHSAAEGWKWDFG
jgi:hypothetical protein